MVIFLYDIYVFARIQLGCLANVVLLWIPAVVYIEQVNSYNGMVGVGHIHRHLDNISNFSLFYL